MGQKVNPIGFRVAFNPSWSSTWFDQKNYARLLKQDLEVQSFLIDRLGISSVSDVSIERPSKRPRVTLYSPRPGAIIGRHGEGIEKLRAQLSKRLGADIAFNVVEVRKPELDAKLVAASIAQQLEKRVSFKRAMRRAIQFALKAGALGIRVACAGRLGGAEIARTESEREGRIPLHKLRADIRYGQAIARTSYGICGVKVWIYWGDVSSKGVSPEADKVREGRYAKP